MDRKKILVVDDEIDLVKAIKIRLEQAGYDVVVAHDGEEGFAKAKEEKPDLVLLDVIMPKLNGHEALQKIKQDGEISSIPVIMLTAKSQVEDINKAASIGAVDYVVKPFSHITLLEKVRDALVSGR